MYVYEGNIKNLANYLNNSYSKLNLHFNHTTETEYFSKSLRKLAEVDSLNLTSYKDFGIQIAEQNRDIWAKDWQAHMSTKTFDVP